MARQSHPSVSSKEALPPSEPDPAARYAVPIDPRDPQEGPREAKVTIVEGFEFLCPYCFMANATVEQILAKYPRDVRVLILEVHGDSRCCRGAASACCVCGGEARQAQGNEVGDLETFVGQRL